MKITLYTVTDCKFSADEKAYLQSKGMQFEEKNLETNRDFLTEMLQKSNNFAGTPVTEVVKDDGSTVVIKGFTPSEFDAALSSGSTAATPAQDPVGQTPTPPVQPPVSEPNPMPAMPTPEAVEEPQMPQTNEAASAMSIPDPVPVPAADPVPASPPVTDMPLPENPQPPAMPEVSAGQILSDNLSSPVNTSSMSPGAGQTFSTEPPAPQGGPISDVTAGISATPNTGMPTDPVTMPQAPVQPADQSQNPLNSVLSDLQSKANS